MQKKWYLDEKGLEWQHILTLFVKIMCFGLIIRYFIPSPWILKDVYFITKKWLYKTDQTSSLLKLIEWL